MATFKNNFLCSLFFWNTKRKTKREKQTENAISIENTVERMKHFPAGIPAAVVEEVLAKAVAEKRLCCTQVLLHRLHADLFPFSPDFISLHSPTRGNNLIQKSKGEKTGPEQLGDNCDRGEG